MVEKWSSLNAIMANRDFIMLSNDEVQGTVKIGDLPVTIEKYNLDKLNMFVLEKERDMLTKIYTIDYFPDGSIKENMIVDYKDLDHKVEGMDSLNIFGRFIVNNKLMEKYNEHHN